MKLFLEDERDPVFFNPVFREYYFQLANQPNIITMVFCPWCGTKFPKSLREDFFNIIFDDLNLDDQDDPRLPSEFKTDEWWKKRGL